MNFNRKEWSLNQRVRPLLCKGKSLTKFAVVLLAFGVLQSFTLESEDARTASVLETVQSKKTVKGTITDANGEAVIGAGVRVKGGQAGTASDIDGNFTIAAEAGDVLVVSYVGFVTQEIKIGNETTLKVVLKENSELLDEVVIVGYGTQKKVNVTGAVGLINSDAIENRPISNVSQALQGQIPGLNLSVGNGGGALNSSMSINIRGTGSIGDGSNSSPLILIDGVEGDMNSINPNDIENISVLKDASSASIYGARAAFGVILITTKQGKSGKAVISYSGNVRFSDALHIPEMLDSYTFAQYFNRAAANDGGNPVFSDEVMQRIKDYQAGTLKEGTILNKGTNRWENYQGANANTDWFAEMYKNWVPSHEHNLSISGGTESVRYLLSGNFMNQEGLIKHGGDNMKRYSINARITAALNKYIDLTYGSRWIRNEFNRPTYLTDLFFHNIARRWPTNPVFDPNGYYMEGNEVIQLRDGGRQTEQTDNLYQQIQFVFKPLEGWRIVADGNLRTQSKTTHWDVLPIYGHDGNGDLFAASWDGRAAGATEVNEQMYKENFLTTNIFSDYEKSFVSGHSFKVMGGFNAELMKTQSVWAQRDGLLSPGDVTNVQTGSTNLKNGGSAGEWAVAGFFGRVNYDYKGRYLAELNMRYDGSSRFIGDQRWDLFPSFSLGWNIARESFWKNLEEYVNTLKLRGSWGELGNMNTTAWYPFYQTMPIGVQNGSWLLDPTVKPNTASAPGIVSSMMTWETVRSWNIALDWGALNNRLTGSFDYFVADTKDMIGPAPALPNILGTSVPKVNNADQRRRGWELEIAWRDKIGDFSYGAKFILSDYIREITRYPQTGKFSEWYVGKRAGEIWGYETVGIAKSQEEMDAHLASLPNGGQKNLGSDWGAGDIMYKDLNGDGMISSGSGTLTDPGDMKIIGNSTPRYEYGISLDASWKGFDLNLFFQGTGKRDLWLDGPYFWGANGGQWQSAGFKEHMNFFREEGDPLGANLNGYLPKVYFAKGGKNQNVQTRYLQDGSYIRLKNIQLGYTLPRKAVNKFGASNLRVYLSCENLWTKSNIADIFDPETSGGGWGNGKIYPLQKVVSFGLNLNF